MPSVTKLITGETLLAMGDIGRCELLNGEIVPMSPSGFDHGRLSARVAHLLSIWNDQAKRGLVLGAETGFRLTRDPDTVRAPDVSFVAADRLGDEMPSGFFEGAPDLAVEVVSPSDSWPDVRAKAEMWLQNGCQSCWVIDPPTRRVWKYLRNGTVVKLDAGQALEDDLLPGFRCSVASLFAR